jgi:hypothetical protein
MAAMAKVPEDSETTRLIEQPVRGDQRAWAELLGRHGGQLRRMVALRLDRRLQGRVAPSDIIQEACLDAARRLPKSTHRHQVSVGSLRLVIRSGSVRAAIRGPIGASIALAAILALRAPLRNARPSACRRVRTRTRRSHS